MVAERAGVTTALTNYYFGTKFGLYEAVYLRQATTIANARLEGLYRLEQSGSAGGWNFRGIQGHP